MGFYKYQLEIAIKKKLQLYRHSFDAIQENARGIRNSPAIFQRVMNLVLKGLIGVYCVVYIDDILVFRCNIKEHNENLNKVIERLSEYRLKENKEKRVLRKENVKFIGYEISFNKLKPSLDRAQGIIDYAVPRTKKELQRFFGMINFDRILIKNLSTDLKNLYALTVKDVKFNWTSNETNIFNEIKDK
ncbi:Retrovirus-related Pol polyprotein from transposon 17.6 [Dictyocoela muelleri]|nr:Retrovirus-related Pol polyprotein from transposon 17.6 [Dictyocoela muelleri]